MGDRRIHTYIYIYFLFNLKHFCQTLVFNPEILKTSHGPGRPSCYTGGSWSSLGWLWWSLNNTLRYVGGGRGDK